MPTHHKHSRSATLARGTQGLRNRLDTILPSRRHVIGIWVITAVMLFDAASAYAQFGDKHVEGTRLGERNTSRWKVGVIVRADGGPCKALLGTLPVPTEWPEQQVRVVSEDIAPQVKSVRYRMISGGVRQMVVHIPRLSAGETAQALITFEIDRHIILPPSTTEGFHIAESIPRGLRRFILPSPLIEVRHPRIVALAKQLRDPSLSAWEQVEQIYDEVRERVEYKNGKIKGALAALRDGDGDCEELTSLFIALCRANRIPARTVWVPGHCYPEFYLVDKNGDGHWFPCQAAGSRDFGGLPDRRPILQKGDNFKVPGYRNRQRYVAESLKGSKSRSSGRPNVRFVRELVPMD